MGVGAGVVGTESISASSSKASVGSQELQESDTRRGPLSWGWGRVVDPSAPPVQTFEKDCGAENNNSNNGNGLDTPAATATAGGGVPSHGNRHSGAMLTAKRGGSITVRSSGGRRTGSFIRAGNGGGGMRGSVLESRPTCLPGGTCLSVCPSVRIFVCIVHECMNIVYMYFVYLVWYR